MEKQDFNFSTTNFDMNEKAVNCPQCRFPVRYFQHKSAFEVHNKYQDYFNDIQKLHVELIDELQDFFPDTPIKEYFEMKKLDFVEALQLLTKKDSLSEIDRIKLDNNFWIKKINFNPLTQENKPCKP